MASDFVYIAGATTNKVFKLLKSDMSKVAESASYGGIIYALTEDDDFVYCAGATTQKVYKLQKSDMAKVAESASYGGIIYALSSDANFVYIGGATTLKIYKLQKSDMAKVAETTAFSTSCVISAIINDTNYFYWCGNRAGSSTRTYVGKGQKSDMAKLLSYEFSTGASGGIPYALAQDNAYVYAGGQTESTPTYYIRQLKKADLTLNASSASYGGIVKALATIEGHDYLYAGGEAVQKVWKILKSTMAKDSESASFGKNIYGLALNTEYLYVVG